MVPHQTNPVYQSFDIMIGSGVKASHMSHKKKIEIHKVHILLIHTMTTNKCKTPNQM